VFAADAGQDLGDDRAVLGLLRRLATGAAVDPADRGELQLYPGGRAAAGGLGREVAGDHGRVRRQRRVAVRQAPSREHLPDRGVLRPRRCGTAGVGEPPGGFNDPGGSAGRCSPPSSATGTRSPDPAISPLPPDSLSGKTN
jgi:hypothetical protein